MKKNNRYQKESLAKAVKCTCGGSAKFVSRKNYPFGKNSKPLVSKFYKCSECNANIPLSKSDGGKSNGFSRKQ